MIRSSSDGVAVRYVLPMNYVMYSYHGANGPESSTTLCVEDGHQVMVPVVCQTTIECSVEFIKIRQRGRRSLLCTIDLLRNVQVYSLRRRRCVNTEVIFRAVLSRKTMEEETPRLLEEFSGPVY